MLPNEIYLDEDFLTYEMTETLLNAVEIDQARISSPPPSKKKKNTYLTVLNITIIFAPSRATH